MKSEVPELMEYHETIAQLWHHAWPARELEGLAALLPDLKAGAARVQQAALPGILRDKKPAWDQGVAALQEIVSQYEAAIQREDLQASLDAGERLHAQFEKLVRIVRPALREIDAFHQALYKLYHYDLPAWNTEAIRASVAAMKEKMTALEQARLPERMASKTEAFESRRRLLGQAVRDLGTVAGALDRAAVEGAVETVHDRYQALEEIF